MRKALALVNINRNEHDGCVAFYFSSESKLFPIGINHLKNEKRSWEKQENDEKDARGAGGQKKARETEENRK
jgi:hypothetical protein